MNDDAENLRRYTEENSEDAFATLVQRYLPLVYGAALRRVGGDVHRAQDVSQLVFTALARNARNLATHPDLVGWFFTTTQFLAAKTVRGEQRRRVREQAVACDPSIMNNESQPDVSAALPAVLDDALMELRQLDRQMLLLRFHRGLRLAEIGAQLGVTENSVQKRLDRALEQLREKLSRRGVTSSAAALALAFETQSAVAVPAGLAAATTTAGLAGGVGASGLVAISSIMTFSKLQIGVAAAVAVATSGGLVWEFRYNARLRAEIAGQRAALAVRTRELQQQLTALTQRANAAEADAAKLQKAIIAAKAAAPTPGGRVLVDNRNAARDAINRAGKLGQAGEQKAALDEYLRIYRELDRPRGLVDQQLVMTGLVSLGRTYPPALAALRELRDAAMQKLKADPDNRAAVSEIALLNERLGDGALSVTLYDSLPAGHPGRQVIAATAQKSFMEARRYQDAFVGKVSFGTMLSDLDRSIRIANQFRDQAGRSHVIEGVLSNIEVLSGLGKQEETKILTEKLLAFDSSEVTRVAIKEHIARAGQAVQP